MGFLKHLVSLSKTAVWGYAVKQTADGFSRFYTDTSSSIFFSREDVIHGLRTFGYDLLDMINRDGVQPTIGMIKRKGLPELLKIVDGLGHKGIDSLAEKTLPSANSLMDEITILLKNINRFMGILEKVKGNPEYFVFIATAYGMYRHKWTICNNTSKLIHTIGPLGRCLALPVFIGASWFLGRVALKCMRIRNRWCGRGRKSNSQGKIHLCGHDGHIAMLLEATNIL